MNLSEPRRVFQLIGLMACAVVGTPPLVDFFFELPTVLARKPALAFGLHEQAAVLLWMGIAIACALGFAAAFWGTTQLAARETKARKLAWLLLVLQVLLAFMISMDFLYIVAAEAPFVLRGRSGLFWLGGQCTAAVGFVVFLASRGHLADIHTPAKLIAPFTILDSTAWIIFAFAIGYLVIRAETGRRMLARTNAELMATQLMLADSSRVGERLRISRDLHDAMGHRLTALNIQLELASRLATGPSCEPVGEARAVAKTLLAEVREVVSELRERREINLKQAIAILVQGVARPQIHLALSDDLDLLDPSRAHALFRCVQEVITNAMKHSGAENLWIELDRNPQQWRLCVRDDGGGVNQFQEGNGLRGLRERIEEMGGNLVIKTPAGQGFQLCGTIPDGECAL